MKRSLARIVSLKVLLLIGTSLLAVSASIVFGIIDEGVLNYAGDENLATKVVYTTGGFGFIVIVLAGMYYFQYIYRL